MTQESAEEVIARAMDPEHVQGFNPYLLPRSRAWAKHIVAALAAAGYEIRRKDKL